MYDPATGRWLTQDPLAEKYYGASLYAFCGNNPVNIIDPDGKRVIPKSQAELNMIHNTLPKEARDYVKVDKNGFIDQALLDSYSGKSLNFNSLKKWLIQI